MTRLIDIEDLRFDDLIIPFDPVPTREYGYKYKLEEYLTIVVKYKGVTYQINIDKGFITDGATISLLRAFISPFDIRWLLAALIHDALYTYGKIPREICDNIFLLVAHKTTDVLNEYDEAA